MAWKLTEIQYAAREDAGEERVWTLADMQQDTQKKQTATTMTRAYACSAGGLVALAVDTGIQAAFPDNVVGYAATTGRRSSQFMIGKGQCNCAALTSVYVEPKHQRMGVGRRLVGALFDKAVAAGCSGLHADVALHTKKPAQGFYERLGFVVCNEDPAAADEPDTMVQLSRHVQTLSS